MDKPKRENGLLVGVFNKEKLSFAFILALFFIIITGFIWFYYYSTYLILLCSCISIFLILLGLANSFTTHGINESAIRAGLITAVLLLCGCGLLIIILSGLYYHLVSQDSYSFFADIDLTKISVFVVALATLGWGGWRCAILTIQTSNQTQQIEQSRFQVQQSAKQIEMADRNSIAKLLVEAAALIEDDNKPKRKAALEILAQIASSEDIFFAEAALSIMEGQLEGHTLTRAMFEEQSSFLCRCYRHVERIHKKNRTKSDVHFVLEAMQFGLSVGEKDMIFLRATYANCYFHNMHIRDSLSFVRFHETSFVSCNIECAFSSAVNCKFLRCKISYFDYLAASAAGEQLFFSECDFSECTFFKWHNANVNASQKEEYKNYIYNDAKLNPNIKNSMPFELVMRERKKGNNASFKSAQ